MIDPIIDHYSIVLTILFYKSERSDDPPITALKRRRKAVECIFYGLSVGVQRPDVIE
jgi:hypothetical protein